MIYSCRGKHAIHTLIPIWLIVIVLISACGGGGGGGETDFSSKNGSLIESEGLIGSEGGVVEVTNPNSPIYGTKLEIPQNALPTDTTISIGIYEIEPSAPEGFSKGGNTIVLTPSGLNFLEPVKLIVPHVGNSDANFYVYNEEEDSWDLLGTIIIKENFEITLKHFTDVNSLCKIYEYSPKCYGVEPCSTISFHIDANSSNIQDLSEEKTKDEIRSAVDEWQKVLAGNLTFKETSNVSDADILFSWKCDLNFYDIPLRSEALGMARKNNDGQLQVLFNDCGDYKWVDSAMSSIRIRIKDIALHEIGHTLGLTHTCDDPAENNCSSCEDGPVMANNYSPTNYCGSLQENDIERILALYNQDCKNSTNEHAISDYIWVSGDTSGLKIHKESLEWAWELPGGTHNSIAVDDKYVWLTTYQPDWDPDRQYYIERYDKKDGSVSSSLFLNSTPYRIAVDKDSVYVTMYEDHELLIFDKNNINQIYTTEFRVGNYPSSIVVDDKWIWIINDRDNTIQRITKSPLSHEFYNLDGRSPGQIAHDNEYVYVPLELDGMITIIKKTDLSKKYIRLDKNLTGVAVDDNYIWASDRDSKIYRINKNNYDDMKEYLTRSVGRTYLSIDNKYLWLTSYNGLIRFNKATLAEDLAGNGFITEGDLTGYLYDYFFNK